MKILRSKALRKTQERKRKMTADKVCHFILFPVVCSAVGKKNDFYIHALQLCWNDKNILKDSRCQQMLRGLHLTESVDIKDLSKSTEGWFNSSRHNDLEKIGKVAGYFLRNFSCSVGKALDKQFNPELDPASYTAISDKEFDDFINTLKNEKTIVPAIVKLEISAHSSFDPSNFICLTEKQANDLFSGEDLVLSRCCKIMKVSTEFHNWSWRVLDLLEHEDRQKLLSDGIIRDIPVLQEIELSTLSVQISPPKGDCEISLLQVSSKNSNRSTTSRLNCQSKRYPPNLYYLN